MLEKRRQARRRAQKGETPQGSRMCGKFASRTVPHWHLQAARP